MVRRSADGRSSGRSVASGSSVRQKRASRTSTVITVADNAVTRTLQDVAAATVAIAAAAAAAVNDAAVSAEGSGASWAAVVGTVIAALTPAARIQPTVPFGYACARGRDYGVSIG